MTPNDPHWAGGIRTADRDRPGTATQRGRPVQWCRCRSRSASTHSAFDPEVPERIAVPRYLPDTDVTLCDLATLAWQIREMDACFTLPQHHALR